MFNGYRVSVLQDEKSSGDGLPNNVHVLNTSECIMLVKVVNLVTGRVAQVVRTSS